MHLVLRSDGRLLFCEHGLAPEKKLQIGKRLEPIWSRVAGGCRLTKDIPSIIEQAGFDIADMDQMYLPGAPKCRVQFLGFGDPIWVGGFMTISFKVNGKERRSDSDTPLLWVLGDFLDLLEQIRM